MDLDDFILREIWINLCSLGANEKESGEKVNF